MSSVVIFLSSLKWINTCTCTIWNRTQQNHHRISRTSKKTCQPVQWWYDGYIRRYCRFFSKGFTFLVLKSFQSSTLLTLSMLWADSADDKPMISFLMFPRKFDLTLHANSTRETIRMKWQILFSRTKKKLYFKMVSANFLSSMQSAKGQPNSSF